MGVASVRAVFEAEPSWRDGMRAATEATLRCMREDPAGSRLVLVESLRTSTAARARMAAQAETLVDLIDRGRHERPQSHTLPRTLAEGIAGAMYQRLVSIARHGEPRPSATVVSELMYVAVLPYLGREAARRELAAAG